MNALIQSLVTGTITKDAERKMSANGNAYASMVIKIDADPPLFVRASIFGDDAESMWGLKRGDSVSAVGRLDVGVWHASDGPTPSLSLMAHRAISPTAKTAKRKPQATPERPQKPALLKPAGHSTPANVGDLSDDLPWSEQA